MQRVNPSTALRVNGERSRTIKFITLGCKVNQYDTQSMREQFASSGFKEIDDGEMADIYVINTCTVTASADRKSRYSIYSAHRQNPEARIIVTGCYTTLDYAEIAKISGVTRIVKNQDKDKIVELLNVNGDSDHFFQKNCRCPPTGISNFSGHTRAFLKIQDGCNNSCSYCKVPMVRGVSRSRPWDDIIREAERLVKNGFKEIVLCGICLGAYGKDLQSQANLVEVIGALETIEGLSRIRLSSIEAGDISDELINQMAKSKKLCPHFHIPIQSGDNAVLKKMNRGHTREDYLRLIKKIKRIIPDIAITIDLLVGFPGEKEDNFRNTLLLIKEIMPLRVHIFPYSQRSGTPAYVLKDKINPLVINKRVLQLMGICGEYALAYKKTFLNKEMDLLIEGRPREDNKYWEGYTNNYIKVRVKSDKDLQNQIIQTRLKKINKDFMLA